MTILWLVALPLGVALVVLLLRNLRLIAAPLSAATLTVMIILFATRGQTISQIILGRSVGLTLQESVGLAFCCFLLALLMIYSYRLPQGPLAYPLTLLAMSLFVAATMVRNLAIAGLILGLGAIAAVMLVPSRRPGSAMAGMRALILLVLAIPLLLLAAWAMESRGGTPNEFALARVGGLTLALGFAIGLAVVPFFVWLPPVFGYGDPLAMVMLSVVLNIAVLLRLSHMLQASMWPGGREFFSTLLIADGIGTALVGSLLALPQRSVSRALAYAAMADLGVVLLGLGIGSETSVSAAILHVGYRGVGIMVVSMALGILRHCLDGDDIDHLRTAWRRAPFAVAGMAIGGLSLAGLPLTAGFTTRLLLYRALAAHSMTWAVAIIACSLGPAWAFMRCVLAAMSSAPTSGIRREPFVPGLLTLLLGLTLLIVGFCPYLLTLLPIQGLGTLFPGVFNIGG